MDKKLLSALQSLDVATLDRSDWIAVGMALKDAGYPCSVWDDWSRNDKRYRPGECQRLWEGFDGSNKENAVTVATIIHMAQEHGWSYFGDDGCLDWDDTIQYDEEDEFSGSSEPEEWDQTGELITYLETLFKPDDIVDYVTNEVWQREEDGKWLPRKGVYDRTAGELIESLRKHPDDIAMTIGDWNPEAGAWIRINPLDGDGVKNENVTEYRYALVESDTLTVQEQNALYRKLQLPIACLVYSGGKSLHAIVKVDAPDYKEYQKRVAFLYDYMEKHGAVIDKQNRNPSRLSRMPGVTRNGNRQYLADTNIGCKSWADWMDCVGGDSDELPPFEKLSLFKDNMPERAEVLIDGILRKGHKMMISGPSKAGKSFLLMELCIAFAEGSTWLGQKCKKSKVLYVNLEIDKASALNRLGDIYAALGKSMDSSENITTWNLRGHAVPLDKLVPELVYRVNQEGGFDVVMIDPIYKVITGDENNASEMGYFCNQFDKICSSTGCAVIYCHHHSKGAQGGKRAMDRASGSGVFARDPDAQLDIIQLELTDDLLNNVRDGYATAWRLETSLREFPNLRPVNFWFEYPLHRVDTSGELSGLSPEGSPLANLSKSSKRTTAEERKQSLDTAYDVCGIEQPVTTKAMAEYLGVSERCVRDRLAEFEDDYWRKGGIVGRKE